MASARQRDGRWTGLYRDQGRQRSAGTYDTKTSALKAARAAEALAASGIDPRPAQTEMLYPSARRGRITQYPTFRFGEAGLPFSGHAISDLAKTNVVHLRMVYLIR